MIDTNLQNSNQTNKNIFICIPEIIAAGLENSANTQPLMVGFGLSHTIRCLNNNNVIEE